MDMQIRLSDKLNIYFRTGIKILRGTPYLSKASRGYVPCGKACSDFAW